MTVPYSEAFTAKAIFERCLEKYADRPAVQFGDEQVSYAELDRRSNALANAFVDRGVGPEDRVVLMLGNQLEYVVADLALIKAGAAKMALNDMLSADECKYMLSDASAGTVVCGPRFFERFEEIRDSLPALENTIALADEAGDIPADTERYETLLENYDSSESPVVDVSPEDTFGHYYTGGTTGKPKGVIHTNRSVAVNMYSHLSEIDIDGTDTLLLMTPLSHSAGAFLWTGLLCGAFSIVRDGFDATRTLQDIEDYDVTWTFMVPTMIYRVLDHDQLPAVDTSSVQTLMYGAAPMTAPRLEEGIEEFGPVFKQFYGQTEVPNLITTLGHEEHRIAIEDGETERLSSAGTSCLMTDVKIVDVETDEEVPRGEEGEILATAPYVMSEYYERPEATEETLVDGWVRTGDIGKLDEDGYLYLLDRKSDMIVTGGMNVYSTEVEDALNEHPGIKEVAVIGVPDDHWGEAVLAVVHTKEGQDLSEDEVILFADERLADYKKPKEVEFIETIPTTPVGKIDKKALRDPYWEEEDRSIG